MSSGVGVDDEVVGLFKDMKVQKSGDDQNERVRIVTFIIDDDCIKVETVYRQKDLKNKDVYQIFLSALKGKSCRYVLYDCHFETMETKKEELVFGLWNPDDACVKDKLLYSSSKGSLNKVFTGLKHNIAINGYSDIEDKDSFVQKLGKKVTHLEGFAV